MENAAGPDNKIGREHRGTGKRSKCAVVFIDVQEQLFCIFGRREKWHWGARCVASKPERVTDVRKPGSNEY